MDALNRNLQTRIKQLSANFPIIVILSVRQCGKSTLAKFVGRDWIYYDLEKFGALPVPVNFLILIIFISIN